MPRQILAAVVVSVALTLAATVAFNRPAAVAQNRNANGEQLWDYATLRIEGADDLIWQATTDADQTRGKPQAVIQVIGQNVRQTGRNTDPVFAAGRAGWELVSAQELGQGGRVYWFKRHAR